MNFRTELSKLITKRKEIVESFQFEIMDLHLTVEQEEQIRSDLKLMELILELYDQCEESKKRLIIKLVTVWN